MSGEVGEVDSYVQQLTGVLRGVIDDDLRAVYVIGSNAMGGYLAGASDIDVLAVSDRPLAVAEKERLVGELSAIPCPARGVELVVYPTASVVGPDRSPRFELNCNVGPGMGTRISYESGADARHWFLLDLAMARERARPIVGPPPMELIGPIPRGWILEALAESLAWHRDAGPIEDDNAVLNACRTWRFVVEGEWSSKDGAAAWAQARSGNDARLNDAAVRSRRTGGDPLDRGEVHAFLDFVAAIVDQARQEAERA